MKEKIGDGKERRVGYISHMGSMSIISDHFNNI